MTKAFFMQGSFEECHPLAHWWASLPDRSREGNFSQLSKWFGDPAEDRPAGRGLFIDIGANIGACTLAMLARPDVSAAFAVEPSPANLFYLTSSALASPPDLKRRLMLYGMALGDEEGKHPMYVEHGNAGNSVLDTGARTGGEAAYQIQAGTLDALLLLSGGRTPPYIHLMKIDAQGFEPKILRGAAQLLASGAVNAVKLEVDTAALRAQNASAEEYLNMYISNRYQLYEVSPHPSVAGRPLTDRELRSLACRRHFETYKDLMALRPLPGEPMDQNPIDCAAHSH